MSTKMIEFLKNKFEEAKRVNESFSVRTFAQRAGVSSGAMSEILAGKRPISRKLAERIAFALKLNPTEKSQFLSEQTSQDSLGIKKVRFVNQTQVQYITDPAYFNFLALMDTVNFKNDQQWIAKKLDISVEKVNLIVLRFKEFGFLIEANGQLKKTKDIFSTTDDIKSEHVITSHIETLKSARHSLSNDPMEIRDFTSFSFPADPKLLGKVKERIRAFQDEIAVLMSGSENTEVYKLAINLFPQTRVFEEREQNLSFLEIKKAQNS